MSKTAWLKGWRATARVFARATLVDRMERHLRRLARASGARPRVAMSSMGGRCEVTR